MKEHDCSNGILTCSILKVHGKQLCLKALTAKDEYSVEQKQIGMADTPPRQGQGSRPRPHLSAAELYIIFISCPSQGGLQQNQNS